MCFHWDWLSFFQNGRNANPPQKHLRKQTSVLNDASQTSRTGENVSYFNNPENIEVRYGARSPRKSQMDWSSITGERPSAVMAINANKVKKWAFAEVSWGRSLPASSTMLRSGNVCTLVCTNISWRSQPDYVSLANTFRCSYQQGTHFYQYKDTRFVRPDHHCFFHVMMKVNNDNATVIFFFFLLHPTTQLWFPVIKRAGWHTDLSQGHQRVCVERTHRQTHSFFRVVSQIRCKMIWKPESTRDS